MVVVTNTKLLAENPPLSIATRAMRYHLHKNYYHTIENSVCSVVEWSPLFESHARLFRRVMACFRKHTSNTFHISIVTDMHYVIGCIRHMINCVTFCTTRDTLDERLFYETIKDTYYDMCGEMTTMYFRMMHHNIN